MNMNTNNLSGISDLGTLGIFGLLIFGGIKLVQLSGISKKLDMSINDLSTRTPVDIQQSIVDRAVGRAVDREVRKAVANTSRRVGEQVRGDIDREVRAEVKAQYNDISAKITKKIGEEVANINRNALTKQISERAEELVLQKLEGSTDEALAKFNRGLGNIAKIYEGISSMMSGNNKGGGQPLTFTLNP